MPAVYTIPPATSKTNPGKTKLSIKGLIAKMTAQPIATYKKWDTTLNFLILMEFNSIPISAALQIVQNNIIPHLLCLSVTKV